jgi:hypothetical protein
MTVRAMKHTWGTAKIQSSKVFITVKLYAMLATVRANTAACRRVGKVFRVRGGGTKGDEQI